MISEWRSAPGGKFSYWFQCDHPCDINFHAESDEETLTGLRELVLAWHEQRHPDARAEP